MFSRILDLCFDAEAKAHSFVDSAGSDEAAALRAVAVTALVCTLTILVAVPVGFIVAQPIRLFLHAVGI